MVLLYPKSSAQDIPQGCQNPFHFLRAVEGGEACPDCAGLFRPRRAVGQGRTVEPGPYRDPPPGQLFSNTSQSICFVRKEHSPLWLTLSPRNTSTPGICSRPSIRRRTSCRSWAAIRASPLCWMDRIPAVSPAAPATFWVPASSRSGRNPGMSWRADTLPVPPWSSGSGICPSPHSSRPVPWGP